MVQACRVVAVVRVLAVNAIVGNVDAIVLEVGDGKATGGKFGTVAVVFLHRDARRVAQRIGNAGDATIVHLLARHHGHRLRRFAQGQRQLGRGGSGAGGVRAGVFGVQAQGLTGNGGSAQLQTRTFTGYQGDAVTIDLERDAGAFEQSIQRLGRLQ